MTTETGGDGAATLLTIVIPAYNASAYLERAVEGLDEVDGIEVVVVDDGSTDRTGQLADRWAAAHPDRFRVIHQANRGHGGAINAGLADARGEFFKVLDADDWFDIPSLRSLLALLAERQTTGIDAVFTDFVHERVGKTPRLARFSTVFPAGRVFEWPDTERFARHQVLMMHAIVYRTQLLRECGLRLPEHTFYVDNLVVVMPLARVRRMRYLPVPLYRYLVGREGQSVEPDVMVQRAEQQLLVNRLAFAALPGRGEIAAGTVPIQLHRTLLHHLEGVCAVTSATLVRGGTREHLASRDLFWREIRAESPWLYTRMRNTLLGKMSNLPGTAGRRATRLAYHVARRVVGFS